MTGPEGSPGFESARKARYLRGTDNGKRKGFRLLTAKELTGGKVVDLVLGELSVRMEGSKAHAPDEAPATSTRRR